MAKKMSKMIAKVAMKTAQRAAGQASDWIFHQAKEPKNLCNRIKK